MEAIGKAMPRMLQLSMLTIPNIWRNNVLKDVKNEIFEIKSQESVHNILKLWEKCHPD